MRIWFVNQYAVLPTEAGGTRHHTLAVKLAERGHETSVIAASFSHISRVERHLAPDQTAARETHDAVEWVWLRSPRYARNSLARAWNMLMFGKRVWSEPLLRSLPRPDVVVGSTPPLPAAYGAALLARHLGAAFVAEVRDLWPRALQELGGFSRTHPYILLLRWMERQIYKAASCVITLLPSSSPYLAKEGVAPERILWLPNGVESATAPSQPDARGDRFTVMYAGTHGFANGLDAALDAAKRLVGRSDIVFRLVGDGPDKERLQQRAVADGLNNVVFEDPVAKREINDVLSQADAFLLTLNPAPVFKEGLSPNKLFDYLAAGRPVVFAVEGDLGDLVVDEVGVAARPGDGDSIATAIQGLCDMPPSRRFEMGAAGRTYVRERRDGDALVAELESRLEAVLQGPR